MTASQELKTLRVGHTPDPDDAYMFYGFASGQVKIDGYEIEHVLEDIETLNKKAVRGEIEVTAISAAIYPTLQNKYWIMPVGASVGRNYGPIVVRKPGNLNPSTRRIGIPGKNTTAYLLLRLYAPGYEPVEYKFDEIPAAVTKGEVDYGLLIHEAQLTYGSLGLEKIMDLGVAWMDDTKLPIPLGLDVVRKDLGRDKAIEICAALKKSIEVANEKKDPAVQYAIKYGRGLETKLGEKFVGMYVNNDTLELGVDGEKALNLLFDKAYRAGITSSPTIVEVLRP
jgi:1,4-dihydroxy-6-naphthoate synthase